MNILCFILALISWIEDFSSPSKAQTDWQGDWSSFTINRNEQLQTNSEESSEHALFRPCTAAIDAQWSFFTRIYGGTSTYNLSRFYILSADSTLADGYYVQVGGSNKNITLYHQHNGKATKVIEADNRKQILPATDAFVLIQLIRDAEGYFHLYSWVQDLDNDWMEEGSYFARFVDAQYVALYTKHSTQRGHDFYWDDIAVTGEVQTDPVEQQTSIRLTASSDCLSLHQQGHESEIRLDYEATPNTYTAHMHVYSADGRLIRTCYQQKLLDSTGSLEWDGQNDQGQNVSIGVYVIILDLTSSTAAPIRKRYPIAVIY